MREKEPRRFSDSEESPESDEVLENNQRLIEQFNNPEIIELTGEKLEVVDVQPEKEKTDVPVFLAPGWMSNAGKFRDTILELASKDRRVLSVNNYHGIETEKVGDYPDAELRKMAALVKTLEEKDINQIDIVAHSEGSLYTIIAATLHPEKFRNIVLVAPAGMIGEDSIGRLGVGFSREIVKQTVDGIASGEQKNPTFGTFYNKSSGALSSPLQLIKQVFAISDMQIPQMLKDLKEQGVNISVIHSEEDLAFPMERMHETTQVDQVSAFYKIRGKHNDLYLKAKEYAEIVEKALDAQERKAARKDSRKNRGEVLEPV